MRSRIILIIVVLLRPVIAPAADHRSVLLVTVDTLRADFVERWMSAGSSTWKALAEEGVYFRNHHTVANLTLPAHATLLSGLSPTDHGVRNNLQSLNSRTVTVAERLREQGFKTSAFVSALHLTDEHSGLGQGFSEFSAPRSPQTPAEAAATAAIRWIDASSGPTFVWLHLFDPHTPYDPPAELDLRLSLPADDKPFQQILSQREQWLTKLAHSDSAMISRLRTAGRQRSDNNWPSADSLERLRKELDSAREYHARWSEPGRVSALYAGEMAFADHWAGEVVAAFWNRHPQGVVVMTSDHGEAMGEGDVYFEHNPGLHSTVVRVPMVIADPQRPEEHGNSAEYLTSHMDVSKTLLQSAMGRPAMLPRKSYVIAEQEDASALSISDAAHQLIRVRRQNTLSGIFWGHPVVALGDQCLSQNKRVELARCDALRPMLDSYENKESAANHPLTDSEREERVRKLRSLGYAQ